MLGEAAAAVDFDKGDAGGFMNGLGEGERRAV
jgi:hypothetical protein